MTMIDDYFKAWEECQKKYGKKSVVWYEVGSFMEGYQVHNETLNLGNLDDIVDMLRLIKTKRNKNKPKISMKNPEMSGFPAEHLPKFVAMLLREGYTVAVYNQFLVENTTPPQYERKLTRIYSPGTLVEETHSPDSSFLASIILEEIKAHFSASVGVVDVSTGKSSLYFFCDKEDDTNLTLDSLYKLISSLQPSEITFYNQTTLTSEHLENTLDLSPYITHFYADIEHSLTTVSYQNQFFGKIFPSELALSPIEALDLERYPSLCLALILLLNFAYEHAPNIIEHISKPEIILGERDELQLLGDTLQQFDLLPANLSDVCLFSILNMTETAMGRRLLKFRLTNPIISVEELKTRYSHISEMTESGYENYEGFLKGLPDIERMYRKMALKLLSPAEFASFDTSLQTVKKMVLHFKKDRGMTNTIISLFDKKQWKAFKGFITDYSNTFSLTELAKYGLNNIASNFFQVGVYPELDELQVDISKYLEEMETVRQQLSKVADERRKDAVKLICNDSEGHSYVTTNARCKKIKEVEGEFKYTLRYKTLRGSTKITFTELDQWSNLYRSKVRELQERIKQLYLNKLEEWTQQYGKSLEWVISVTAKLDFIKCASKNALKFGYCKPVIEENKDSFIEAKSLRHPIVERIQDNIPFITNDVHLNAEDNGRILFGLNSSGKSTYLKSVGSAVIMAQAGLYVAANEFRYQPFTKIISKISNRDNLIKGKSTFVLELEHMRNMIQRSDKNTLVLGDELCSGTERPSAIALVSSMVKEMKKEGVKFLLSSHFHDLTKTITKVPFYHFKVSVKKGVMEFDRKLEEGSGESIYGIEIAQSLGLKQEIIKRAYKIRKKMLKEPTQLLSTKKSRYNSKVYMDKCAVCKSREDLHTHHILFQKDANEQGLIGVVPKNAKYNLVVLCEGCHQAVHNDKLVVRGYKETSKGIYLDYEQL